MPRADLRRAMRDRMALTLAESEARHRALLAALPEGVVLHDTDGTFLLANPAACELLELSHTDSSVPSPRSAGEREDPGLAAGYGETAASRQVSGVANVALAESWNR